MVTSHFVTSDICLAVGSMLPESGYSFSCLVIDVL